MRSECRLGVLDASKFNLDDLPRVTMLVETLMVTKCNSQLLHSSDGSCIHN